MGLTKNNKVGPTVVWLISAVLALLVMPDAMASEHTENMITSMQVLSVLFGSEQAKTWITVISLACYVFTQVRAWLPAKWLAKLPRRLVNLMELLAGNYRNACNEIRNNPESYRKSNQQDTRQAR